MSKSEKDKYTKISLSHVAPNTKLVGDVYLYINDHYIKYKEAGDTISTQKYDLFLSRNVSEVFILKVEEVKFEQAIEDEKTKIIESFVKDIGEENRHLAQKREEIKTSVYEVFSKEELTTNNVDLIQNMCSNFIDEVSSGNVVANVLAKLTSMNESVADHAVNTANLAVFIAMILGNGDKKDLENVYLGAIFHDYAKAKIDPSILESPTTLGYSQAIQDHPAKGAKVARSIDNLDPIVSKIVEQHHEQWDGKGYPLGLAGNDIHELSQIVSIANVYDNIITENRNKNKIDRIRLTIKNLEYDRGKRFNPEKIKRVADGLKLAFGNFKRD